MVQVRAEEIRYANRLALLPDHGAAGSRQGLALEGEVLVGEGDAGVTDVGDDE